MQVEAQLSQESVFAGDNLETIITVHRPLKSSANAKKSAEAVLFSAQAQVVGQVTFTKEQVPWAQDVMTSPSAPLQRTEPVHEGQTRKYTLEFLRSELLVIVDKQPVFCGERFVIASCVPFPQKGLPASFTLSKHVRISYMMRVNIEVSGVDDPMAMTLPFIVYPQTRAEGHQPPPTANILLSRLRIPAAVHTTRVLAAHLRSPPLGPHDSHDSNPDNLHHNAANSIPHPITHYTSTPLQQNPDFEFDDDATISVPKHVSISAAPHGQICSISLNSTTVFVGSSLRLGINLAHTAQHSNSHCVEVVMRLVVVDVHDGQEADRHVMWERVVDCHGLQSFGELIQLHHRSPVSACSDAITVQWCLALEFVVEQGDDKRDVMKWETPIMVLPPLRSAVGDGTHHTLLVEEEP